MLHSNTPRSDVQWARAEQRGRGATTISGNTCADGRVEASEYGFTLIELLIVLLLFTMIATLAVPSVVSARQKLQIDIAVQQLTIDLARARSEAVKRNQAVAFTVTGTNTYTVAGVGDRALEGNVTFQAGSATTITFASYGTLVPVASQDMILRVGSETRTVAVSSAGFPRAR